MWEGVEAADSLVLNPHKWLGTGFDLSAYFVRDPQHLVRVMSTDPSYLRTAQDGVVRNLRDWGIPLGRRFRALKLWFLIREYGVEGLQERIRRDMDNAHWLAAQVDAEPGWERLAPVPLQTVCLRHVPAALAGDEAALATHNRASPSDQPGAAAPTSRRPSSRGSADRARLHRRPGHRAARTSRRSGDDLRAAAARAWKRAGSSADPWIRLIRRAGCSARTRRTGRRTPPG